MYFVFVGLFELTALSIAQNPHYAAILTDARYLAGDGTFGAAYTQEDGVQFKEVSDANGDRRGSYSYIDPTGHRRTVEYSAGKNGFQPIGEGIPKVTLPTPPPLGYKPLPKYNSPEYLSQPDPHAQSVPQSPPSSFQYQTEPQYNRELIYQTRSTRPPKLTYQPHYQNEYELTEYQPRIVQSSATRQQRISVSYDIPQVPHQYELKTHQSEAQYRPTIGYPFNHQSDSEYYQGRSEHNDITTPSPNKYHSPGKLDLTRTPDGFSYTFIKS